MNEAGKRARRLLRPELAELQAYHVPDAHGLIKLDAMENPYSWPEEMIGEWLGVLRSAAINRYPDPSASGVRAALRRTAAIPEGAEILLGNGSDELIQIVLMALAGGDGVVLAPEPTFVMYRQLATSLGLRFVGVPLVRHDFSLDMDAMRTAIRVHRPAAIFVAYPNNPTGNLFSADDLLEIIGLADGLVVIDEAYLPFADSTLLPRVAEQDHVLVLRTLSKMGLAGLRLGYLVGAGHWIGEFDKLRLPYNINILTQVTAEFALRHSAVFDAQVRQILEQRESLFHALNGIPGIHAYPSRANFILFEVAGTDASRVFAGLRERGVLVKGFAGAVSPLRSCLRVTVGKPDENQQFLMTLRASLEQV